MTMQVRPVCEALGVEVRGVDLRDPLDQPTVDVLRALFDEHHLLLFPDQDITGADQVRLAAHFGPVLDESRDGSGFTHVSNVRPDGSIREGALLFHSDLAFTPEPILAISLYALEVPADGAPTRWANAARAAAQLPHHLRNAVAGRRGLHIFDLTDSRGDRRFRVRDLPAHAPRADHPVLLPHPRTGHPVLYVNAMQTDAISELAPNQSEALIDALLAVLYAPGNIYEHRWRAGDLVLWDNLALQHGRGDVPMQEPRTLRRVPIGTRAVTLQTA